MAVCILYRDERNEDMTVGWILHAKYENPCIEAINDIFDLEAQGKEALLINPGYSNIRFTRK